MTQKGKAIDLLRRVRTISGGRGMPVMCRGESQWFEEVSSPIWRDHKQAGISPLAEAGMNFNEIEEKVADDVRKFIETPDMPTTEVIDELEVVGGKTNQINFTFDVGVAVWFACQEPISEDGRVIMVQKGAVKSRFAKRGHAPRQSRVLVSSDEGKVPKHKILAIERIPSDLKEEILLVLSRDSGLWKETVFSGRIQTVMGYARHIQGDTSAISRAVICRKEEDRRTDAEMRAAVEIFSRMDRGGGAQRAKHESDPDREPGLAVLIQAADGVRQTDLAGLKGRVWMDDGTMIYLSVRPDAGDVAARTGQIESGRKGLVQLQVPGLMTTDRTWEVTVGKVAEIELICWDDVKKRCSVSLQFQHGSGGPSV